MEWKRLPGECEPAREQNMSIIDRFWTRPLIAALAVLILSLSAATQQPVSTRYPPPGKLVDVGGWRLHLNCTGENKRNTPTVVLESGFLVSRSTGIWSNPQWGALLVFVPMIVQGTLGAILGRAHAP
jgi:hypothetical protein